MERILLRKKEFVSEKEISVATNVRSEVIDVR